MDKIVKSSRLIILIVLVAAMAVVLFVSLYRLQIIDGESYYEQSKNSIVSTSTVAAARGNILDRYGRVMVSNRVCNNLMINDNELFEQEDPNAIILQLVNAVEDSGNTYTDTLPVTKKAPFEYVKNMSDLQRTRLDAYLEEYDLPASTTAVELMAVFRKNFQIDDNYTSEEMRIIAGVRYEVKIRYIIGTSPYVFSQDVSIDLISKLMENDVPGFEVRSSYIREYNTTAAAHLLGSVGLMDSDEVAEYKNDGYAMDAYVGKDGAEKAFESYLHGTDGLAVVTSTKEGTIVNTTYKKEPQPGNNVYLTIDLGLQEAAEAALSSFITTTNSEREKTNAQLAAVGNTKDQTELISGGAVVAIDVKSGEPLAIASYPTYDLSTFFEDAQDILEDENHPLLNRALQGLYAPGSTFKPVTAIAALSEGIITTNTTIYDEVTFTKYPDYQPSCWIKGKGTHGTVNVTQAIEVSCNYFFYTVGDMMGIEPITEYGKQFGLGQKTGIELYEEEGIISSTEYREKVMKEEWFVGYTLGAAIGQDINSFTPIQIANYIACLANDGTRYKTSMLKAVRSFDGSDSLFERKAEVSGTVVSAQENFDAVQLGMYNVANSTSGTAYRIFGNYPVHVAAKTGTAQRGENTTNNGVFVCYAPYEDPEIAIAVVVEKGGSGSGIATIGKDVLDYYLSFKNSANVTETENTLLG